MLRWYYGKGIRNREREHRAGEVLGQEEQGAHAAPDRKRQHDY